MNKEKRSAIDGATTLGSSNTVSWLIAKFPGQQLTKDDIVHAMGYDPDEYLEFNTTWKTFIDSEVVDEDTVGTHFLGWKVDGKNISFPMTLSGSTSIQMKADYSYDFPVDIVSFDNKYDNPGIPPIPSELSARAAIYSRQLANNPVFQELSAKCYPVKITEMTVSSDNALSDIGTSIPINTTYRHSFITYDNSVTQCYFLPGSLSDVHLSDENWENKIASATNLSDINNYDVVLSSHPYHRMALVPKYKKYMCISYGDYGYINSSSFAYDILVPFNEPLSTAIVYNDMSGEDNQSFSPITESNFYKEITSIEHISCVIVDDGLSTFITAIPNQVEYINENNELETVDINDYINSKFVSENDHYVLFRPAISENHIGIGAQVKFKKALITEEELNEISGDTVTTAIETAMENATDGGVATIVRNEDYVTTLWMYNAMTASNVSDLISQGFNSLEVQDYQPAYAVTSYDMGKLVQIDDSGLFDIPKTEGIPITVYVIYAPNK